METKKCLECKVERRITMFEKRYNQRDGRMSVCKLCYVKNAKPEPDKIETWEKEIKLGKPTKEDYASMYEFMSIIGYDVNKDIQEQFIDKWNKVSPKKLKYRRRTTGNVSAYFADGTINDKSRTYLNNKGDN